VRSRQFALAMGKRAKTDPIDAQMSDGTLKDLGLSRADIQQEAERPFWDDPLKH
ncbi:DUF1127 domain-containing protein, partial [Pseudomonas syringae]